MILEEKYIQVLDLLEQVDDPLVHRFFDINSEDDFVNIS